MTQEPPTPLRCFLESNYLQRMLKLRAAGDYSKFTQPVVTQLLAEQERVVAELSDAELAGWLDSTKGLTESIAALPYRQFSVRHVEPETLVPTLWVSDLPHKVTHGSLADVLAFASEPDRNRSFAPVFFDKVEALRRLPALLERLPPLVVSPSSSQRSARRDHHAKPGNTGPKCKVASLVEGEAYVEDGNHRAIARLLESGSPIKVIAYSAT